MNSQCTEKVVNTTPQSYKVWVGNLPMVNQSLILDYLKQWGRHNQLYS